MTALGGLTRDRQQLRVQTNVVNLTDRLNAIDFAALFSGTALAHPRSFGIRLQFDFETTEIP